MALSVFFLNPLTLGIRKGQSVKSDTARLQDFLFYINSIYDKFASC